MRYPRGMPVSPPPPAPARLRLRVTAAAETHVRAGHPWVYESSVREQNRPGEAGELAVIYDRRDRFLAIGLYDPHSPLRVRVLHAGAPVTLDDAWWGRRLDEALLRRSPLFGVPGADGDTNGYRVLNGESDGFGGLVVDRYAHVLVVKLYTAAWFPHLPRMLGLLSARFPGAAAALRLSRNIQSAAAKAGLHDGQAVLGEVPDAPVVFQESGLRFEADVVRGREDRLLSGPAREPAAGGAAQRGPPRARTPFPSRAGSRCTRRAAGRPRSSAWTSAPTPWPGRSAISP